MPGTHFPAGLVGGTCLSVPKKNFKRAILRLPAPCSTTELMGHNYCIVLYCNVLYCTVLYCTYFMVLYCIVLYCIVLYPLSHCSWSTFYKIVCIYFDLMTFLAHSDWQYIVNMVRLVFHYLIAKPIRGQCYKK